MVKKVPLDNISNQKVTIIDKSIIPTLNSQLFIIVIRMPHCVEAIARYILVTLVIIMCSCMLKSITVNCYINTANNYVCRMCSYVNVSSLSDCIGSCN